MKEGCPMYWRSEERKVGMKIPERVQRMQENMYYSVPVAGNTTLVEELFKKNISKIDIAKKMAISK